MEMKRTWIRPQTMIESFNANESVAANPNCTSGTVYKFTCDAPGGRLYYYPYDGTVDGVGVGSPSYIGSYNPCGAAHEAPTDNPFYDGFIDYNRNGRNDSGEAVIVWRGRWHNNGHATANLDINSWEVAKS